INLVSNHPRTDIFLQVLKENNIDILESSKLSIFLNSLESEIECKDEEIVIVDGLEIFLENSQRMTSFDSYISKVREKLPCKNALPISLVLMSGINDEWEEKFDNLGSDNPERDMLEYSNKRELLNHISLEIKRKKESNYKQLQNSLDLIIQQNNSNEDIERVRAKYQKENNSKKIYQKKQQLLIEIAKDLNLNLKNEPIQEKMKELIHRLESQEFSIGVTGIMKAGKSTMMNALLQQEVLGTAIRPETANLSIIKKGQDKAKVYFWSQDEWKKIKKLALDEQGKEFVLVSEKLNGFSKYIGLGEKEIAIEELDYYTSARKSEGLCNLVKEVELKLPLEFLDMGVSLVDTPGIDDPIVQREIITKEYLGSCSAILHLMNAKQSATQKDIEFIGDALLDQGVSSLLVVITRVDTLGNSKEEIDQKLISIITHAKRNIETYLNKRANRDISTVLAKVEFLPLAGKFAMQHRIGDSQKALKKGYELKDTGILEIENYLNSMLFGDKNERAQLAISNAYRSIENDASAYLNQLNEQYSLIGLERNEIDKRLNIAKKEREDVSLQLNEVLLEIEREERDIKEELERLRNLFESQFEVLHQAIAEKMSNYIEEELYNNRKPVSEEI
ncbi:MAG TPA: hypothetical protein ENK88_06845, partial [Campylobacterales bacterium]|nr:hypothetical protein [Campylobacterales bacterium]